MFRLKSSNSLIGPPFGPKSATAPEIPNDRKVRGSTPGHFTVR